MLQDYTFLHHNQMNIITRLRDGEGDVTVFLLSTAQTKLL